MLTLQNRTGFAPMLFQWSHSYMQHFSTEQKLHIKKGSRAKKLHCKKIMANLLYVCQGTYSSFSYIGASLGGVLSHLVRESTHPLLSRIYCMEGPGTIQLWYNGSFLISCRW